MPYQKMPKFFFNSLMQTSLSITQHIVHRFGTFEHRFSTFDTVSVHQKSISAHVTKCWTSSTHRDETVNVPKRPAFLEK